MVIEPLIHPKPGGVSRVSSHPDKDIYDFEVHALEASTCLYRACLASLSGGCVSGVRAGLECYLDLVERLGLRGRNVAFGTYTLLLPLSTSIPHNRGSVEDLARKARECIRGCGGYEGRLYLTILSRLAPSHLRGSYQGPLPSVWEPRPVELWRVFERASWDLVHSELAEGYPRSLAASRLITVLLASGSGLEDAARWALLHVLSSYGDTLIYSKYGAKAYHRALMEARSAWMLAAREGAASALEVLDALWRPRGWNPGAAFDILAVAISLALYPGPPKTMERYTLERGVVGG
ncbi:MAG: triphosphoribosyl-dephospho-CoA synthase [Desulfurococcales archaeon]|nr:triphosphoribosyl-dephospho-CoA synthase [Desulfurococcales archaeon]